MADERQAELQRELSQKLVFGSQVISLHENDMKPWHPFMLDAGEARTRP